MNELERLEVLRKEIDDVTNLFARMMKIIRPLHHQMLMMMRISYNDFFQSAINKLLD